MKNCLIIIDVQNDFIPGGALPVPEGSEVIAEINAVVGHFDYVVATQDWHPPDHGSFASNHEGKKPFDQTILNGLNQTLWPDHCIQGTRGAEFHSELNTNAIQAVFRKGMDPTVDSYSGFYDNGHRHQTGLAGFLKGLDIWRLFFCGLAGDYCVNHSVKDALDEGFQCHLYTPAIRPISQDSYRQILKELTTRGAILHDELTDPAAIPS